jgi:hypothetical protein
MLIQTEYLFLYIQNKGIITCTERNVWESESNGAMLPFTPVMF